MLTRLVVIASKYIHIQSQYVAHLTLTQCVNYTTIKKKQF